MRSLALAQGWKSAGGKVVFVTKCESVKLFERLKGEGFEVVEIENGYPHPADLNATKAVLKENPNAWCVIDGYHFDGKFHGSIRQNGNRVLVIDDVADLDFYNADAILNQNIKAVELKYNCPPETKLLLGTRYALLRKEFLQWQGWQREIPEIARKILITMGGGDLFNQTLKAIRAVERISIENLQIKAVIGASNPDLADLQNVVEKSSLDIELIFDANDMATLMAWADMAISAAGSTCWELCFMSVPTILIVTANNQIGIAEGLSELGFAENLGWFEQVSTKSFAKIIDGVLSSKIRRGKMCKIGYEIVDGFGTKKIVDLLHSYS